MKMGALKKQHPEPEGKPVKNNLIPDKGKGIRDKGKGTRDERQGTRDKG